MDNKKQGSLFKNVILPILLFIAITIVWLISWQLIDYVIEDKQERGTFGDKFGAVNSLFSGLAMAGIIYTILLQRDTILMQKEELELQRNELAETRKEFNIQNETLKKQRFENTFFQMLSLHNEIVSNTILPNEGNNVINKKKAFQHLLILLKDHLQFNMTFVDFQNTRKSTNSLIIKEVEEIFEFKYKDFYTSQEMILGHYL